MSCSVRFVLNLRTGYGLQTQDEKLYEYISDTLLDTKLPVATSTVTIFDPFNYNSLESDQTDGLKEKFDLDHTDLNSELETVISTALVQSQNDSFSDQADDFEDDEDFYIPACGYISTEHSESPGYVTIGQDSPSTVQNISSVDYIFNPPQYIRPLPAHFSEPSLFPKQNRDYVTALTYSSREVINSESSNSLLLDDAPSEHSSHTARQLSASTGLTRSASIPDVVSVLTFKNRQDYVYV